jgi:hypothetical protein
MTENKGAYINIGPDYKLKFSKFDAVPHPDIRPMVSSYQANMICQTANIIPGLRAELGDVLADVNGDWMWKKRASEQPTGCR